MKRAELSFSVIVIAIICLLVLVVVSFIFLRNTGTASNDLASCQTKGGSCQSECEIGQFELISGRCGDSDGDTQVCCIDRDNLFS